MNETDYFEVAKDQVREHWDKYNRKLDRECMLCGNKIPWGYIELHGVIMCDECFEKMGFKCRSCE